MKGSDEEVGMELSERSEGGGALKQRHVKGHFAETALLLLLLFFSVSKLGTQINSRAR